MSIVMNGKASATVPTAPAAPAAPAANVDWYRSRRRIARRSRLYHTGVCLRSYLISLAIFLVCYTVAVLLVWGLTSIADPTWNIDFWLASAVVPYVVILVAMSTVWQFRAFGSAGLSRRDYDLCTLGVDAVFCLIASTVVCLASCAINTIPHDRLWFLMVVPQQWASGTFSPNPRDMRFGVGLTAGQVILGIVLLALLLLAVSEIGRAFSAAMARLGRPGRWIFLGILMVALIGVTSICLLDTGFGSGLRRFFEAVLGISHGTRGAATSLHAGTLCVTLAVTVLLFWGISILVLRTWEERPGERE